MLGLYKFLIKILFPFFFIFILIRRFSLKEHKVRYKEKLMSSYFNPIKKSNFLIWFHAASVGEVMSVFPIIDKMKDDKRLSFLITTLTKSSSVIVEKKFMKNRNIVHRFLPLDNDKLVETFLKKWKPDLSIFVDSEIWPNFITKIKKNNIPLILINARITGKSFKRWMLLPNFAKKIFGCFDICLPSNKDTENFLKILKVRKIKNIGNLKFCSSMSSDSLDKKNLKTLESFNIWCAASTHSPEEEFCLNTHKYLSKDIKNLLTIIIPRHISRVEKIAKIFGKEGIQYQILKDNDEIKKNTSVLIVNSFGILPKFFKVCKSVFIGKSTIQKLKFDSGQNPIEAAKEGCKIYHGPYVENFSDIYNFLKENKICKLISSPDELAINLREDFNSEQYINKNDNIEKINLIGNRILNLTIKEINEFIKI